MNLQRLWNTLAHLACTAAIAVGGATAMAQTYPSKPIKLVIPYPPGGLGDTMARDLGNQLAQRLGQPVVVESRPGASQIIGADYVAKSAGDGYTLFLASLSNLVLNVGSHKALPYDPVKDFAPVSMYFSTPLYLVVNPKLPVKSVTELVAYGKANPGKLTYGSIGAGSSLHLTGEMFQAATGVKMLHVPYKGSAPAITDLIGGQIDMLFDGGTSSLPHVRDGKLRALGVTSAQRASGTPDIPSIAEAGVPGFDATFWFGIVAPASTPQPIVQRLSAQINDILNQPAMRERHKVNGLELAGSTPEEMSARMATDLVKWSAIQKQAGVQPQ
ncbi:tripartite tricarboxylate transporter substrate binding protein [Comamonadaceae bacterium G21597-S1]|nr:tripartite tricarboxylate transporter substrate binding protein [Comamonadaceae bacterium G21597-S1]